MNKGRYVLLAVTLTGFIFLVFFKYQKRNDELNPAENNLSKAGRYLFFDTRLSFNNTKSCASCHDPKFAFSDGYRRSITASGDIVLHNAPSLINAVFLNYFDWADPGITSLEKQHERPLFGVHPVELGVKGNEAWILKHLKADTLYAGLFAKAFPADQNAFTFPNVITAVASYVKTLQSFQSPYDKYLNGNENAISESARKGMKLFSSGRLKCSSCHAPPSFTLASTTRNTDSIYYNNGLYNIGNLNQYPAEDQGLFSASTKQNDAGKFKTPSLRNVTLTAPYMHDGSVNSLEEVIDIYAAGGRNIQAGPYSGDGRLNKLKDKRISGFLLTKEEKVHLIDFLYALTDSTILANPDFKNPWSGEAGRAYR